ncbi:O-methyltransferase [Williamsia sp. CHRR-6]|uniref:O-methyltransferase n=1 Tax=Williamsia sp. CHRR-6 TaxID=2835871 RepID=UPI001BD97FB2|nr:O-methyltransferase [Williamsia sp. CHRR-6]MBT0568471.1 O-methyltransferase [Williamsia sp. CHRR-6]
MAVVRPDNLEDVSDTTGERSADPTALLRYAENAIVEDDAVRAARERGGELGATSVSPAVGATLCLLARLVEARSVVEIGTGAGVSGLWLLAGMRSDGVLTTIDPESEHQRSAKAGFAAAGVAPGRTRLINGRAAEVLPRLADSAYDLVFVDGAVIDQPRYVAEGVRLLRAGGVLVVHNATADGKIADPTQTDPDTAAAREAALLISEDDELLPVVLPLGRGLLAAAKSNPAGSDSSGSGSTGSGSTASS